MRISLFVHGVLDYIFSILVASSPWLFGFSHEFLAPQIAVTCGAASALYSVTTDYECGLVRFIPFSGHCFFDLAVGLTLGGAAWHFGMGGRASWVFGIFGVLKIATVFLTERPRNAGTTAT